MKIIGVVLNEDVIVVFIIFILYDMKEFIYFIFCESK